MPGPKPSARPRPGGGFNQGLGAFGEHLDENALQQAVSQKQAGQQATAQQAAVTAGQGGGKAGQQLGAAQLAQQLGGGDDAGVDKSSLSSQLDAQKQPPRELGALKDELIKRPAQDIVKGLKSIFDINSLLGIDPKFDTPEEQAKKRQLHQRWQKLTQDEQDFARRKYQQEMELKKQEEEEKELKKQQEEEQNKQAIAAPASPQKGPVGPSGSKKQRAAAKLQQDRQSLGGPKGSN